MKVKICGITNLEDALAAFFAGADAIGFVFYDKSPRYISPAKAANIAKILPEKIKRVGVFVNADAARVKKIAKLCGLDMLQFHGQERAGYCRKFKKYEVIKAFRINDSDDLEGIAEYETDAYLFDSFSRTKLGGTGKKFNWKILAQSAKIMPVKTRRAGGAPVQEKAASGLRSKKPVIFLSGGLAAGNIRKAIRLLNPGWVDVSSSLESKPGKKDHRKIRKFMRKVKLNGGSGKNEK